MQPVDDDFPPDLPPEAVPHDRPRPQPLGSPYAIPLGTLTAGAYVAVTDQVQVQPVHEGLPSAAAAGGLGTADDAD